MHFWRNFFLYALLFCSFCQLFSQEYLFDAQLLDTEDGLSSLGTSRVYKGKNGYLWISTNNGLNRYDGYDFTHYTQKKNGLDSNKDIHEIKQDEAGNLWLFYSSYKTYLRNAFNNVRAIDIFNPQTEKAEPFNVFFNNKAPFSIDELAYTHIIDAANRVWLTTKSGELYLFKDNQFLKIYEEKNAPILYLTVDDKDNIWLGYEQSITQINLEGKVQETTYLTTDLFGLWIDDIGTLWWATGDWVADYMNNLGSNTILKEEAFYKTIIWSKNQQGTVSEFSLKKGTEPITLDIKGRFLLYRSKAGHWYAQVGRELNVFDEDGQFLYNYYDLLGINLEAGSRNCLEVGDNEFWLATPLGLVKTTAKLNPFRITHSKWGDTDYRGITEGEDGTIFFLCKSLYLFNPKNEDRVTETVLRGYFTLIYTDSIIWSGGYTNRYTGGNLDLRTHEMHMYKNEDQSSLLFSYTTLPVKLPYDYLIGTNKGLNYLNIQQKKIRPFTQYNGFEILKQSDVYYLHKNEKGIWVATNNGIFLMDEKEGIIRKYDIDSKDLPFNFIRHIYEDETGVFWLATNGGGIIQWNPAQKKEQISTYRQFTTKDGLSHNATYAIYGDDYGKLWIPSDKGLMCMDAETYEVNVFLKEDGLPHNEFNLTAHYQAKDGTLYFGGLGGLISFHPKSFEERLRNNNYPLKFIKCKVLEDGKTEETDKTAALFTTSNITIAPTDKFLELQFGLLDFDDPSQHSYAYQLKGYSEQWTHTDENYVRITSLPYGDYRLRVKGRNIGKGWSKQELSLGITVIKPFYLENWFIGLTIISLVGLIVLAVKWRLQSLEKDRERLEKEVAKRTATIQEQSEKLQALDKAKTRFFSNITHEFRTPLTLVIGPLEQVLEAKLPEKSKGKLASVLNNARHLLGLINQLLDLSKLESGQMKVEVTHGDINAYTKELVHSIKPLADKKEQTLQIVIAETAWETQFDKKKWTKIIYNLLSNAIKYTPEKGVIQFELMSVGTADEEQIHLRIKDSGIGIKKNQLSQIFNRFYQIDDSSTRHQEGTGIGLSLVKELVELQGGSIDVVSEYQKGTTFDIKLPIYERSQVMETNTLPITAIETVSQLPISKEKIIPVKHSIPTNAPEQLEILIIEDNEEMRAYIRDCLEETQYRITEASNGIEGIAKAIELIPDLIISDVMMPGKNGFEVTAKLRSTVATSHIPIVLLTAKSALESRIAGFQSGADVYLTKPFSPKELSLRIQKLIEIRALIRNSIRVTIKDQLKPAQKEVSPSFQKENLFVKAVRIVIEENLNTVGLNGEFIGMEIGMSRMQLHRKLKAVRNQSISSFIKEIRLEKAYELLQTQNYNSSEVAFRTGFNTLAYFSRTFKDKYGCSPSDLLKEETI